MTFFYFRTNVLSYKVKNQTSLSAICYLPEWPKYKKIGISPDLSDVAAGKTGETSVSWGHTPQSWVLRGIETLTPDMRDRLNSLLASSQLPFSSHQDPHQLGLQAAWSLSQCIKLAPPGWAGIAGTLTQCLWQAAWCQVNLSQAGQPLMWEVVAAEVCPSSLSLHLEASAPEDGQPVDKKIMV